MSDPTKSAVANVRAVSWRRPRLAVVVAAILAASTAIVPLGSSAVAATVPLRITALSQTSAESLTPLQITVSGLKGTKKISVTFSIGSRTIATDVPFSVTGKVIVVGVPIFLSSTTGQSAATTATVKVRQLGRASRTRAITIQAMPSDAAMGLPVGQLSHDFLIFQALMLSKKLNALQAEQALQGVDNSAQIQDVGSLLSSTIEARNDIDRILIDPNTVIGSTTYPNGAPISFNADTVAMMDSFVAEFLQQSIPAPAGSALQSARARHPHLSAEATMAIWSSASGSADAAWGLSQAKSTWEYVSAGMQAAAGLCKDWCSQATPVGKYLATAGAATMGAVFMAADFSMAYNDAVSSQAVIQSDIQHNVSPETMAADQATANAAASKFHKALYSLGCVAVGALGDAFLQPLAGPACVVVVDALEAWGQLPFVDAPENLNLTSNEAYNMANAYNRGTDPEIAATFAAINPSGATTGYALETGTADIANVQGVASSQGSMWLCCFGTTSYGISTLDDPSGNYEMWVPIGAPSTSYNDLSFYLYDFITGTVLSSIYVNLSSATLTSTVVMPTMSGTCNDTDVLAPDSDDPDCD